MNKKIGIYAIRNTKNDKQYIGLSTNIDVRFIYHKRSLLKNKHGNKHIQSSVNKYGINSFEFIILEECDTEMLCEREKFWIAHYQTHQGNFGYNKTFGGEFGRVTEEANESRRAKLRLQTIPQEQRDKISKTLSGKKRPDRYKFDNAVELQIIDDYNNKLSARVLSKKYNCSTTAIYNIIKRNTEK